MKCIKVVATGNVQGVAYRAHAKLWALRYGIKGFAQNMPDGTVLLNAKGDPAKIDKWVAKISCYPSKKTQLDIEDIDPTIVLEGFKIL